MSRVGEPGLVERAIDQDRELLERWRANDKQAGEALLERHFAGVYRFFCNKLPREAEDLTQQTFLACVEGQTRFQGNSKFRTFLFGIAKNVLYSHLRRRHSSETPLDFSVSAIRALDPSPSQLFANERDKAAVLEALRAIPLDLQVAIELHYWEGLSTSEISEALEIPQGTVKRRLQRARVALSRAMGLQAKPGREAGTTPPRKVPHG